jgi:hypothetical protein
LSSALDTHFYTLSSNIKAKAQYSWRWRSKTLDKPGVGEATHRISLGLLYCIYYVTASNPSHQPWQWKAACQETRTVLWAISNPASCLPRMTSKETRLLSLSVTPSYGTYVSCTWLRRPWPRDQHAFHCDFETDSYRKQNTLTRNITTLAWTVFVRSDAVIVSSNPASGIDVWCVRLLCLCWPVCRKRPCDGLICRPRNLTDRLKIKKLQVKRVFHGYPMLQRERQELKKSTT